MQNVERRSQTKKRDTKVKDEDKNAWKRQENKMKCNYIFNMQ